MKWFLFVFLIILLGCKSKKVITENVENKKLSSKISIALDNVDKNLQNKTYELGFKLMNACNTSKFKNFSNTEATKKVIQNITPEKISITCKKIAIRNGAFINMQLTSVFFNEFTKETIFNYELFFEKKYFKRQLQITLNSENLICSILTKESKPKLF